MPEFNAQNTDAENSKSAPSVTKRDKVTLIMSKSAAALAASDNQDTPTENKNRPGNDATTAQMSSKYAK